MSTPPSEDYLNEFSAISNTRSFNLVAKSAREKDDWMKVLANTFQDNIRKGRPNSRSPFVDITAVLVGRSSVATVLATKLRYSTRTMNQLVFVTNAMSTFWKNLTKRILREPRPKSMNSELGLRNWAITLLIGITNSEDLFLIQASSTDSSYGILAMEREGAKGLEEKLVCTEGSGSVLEDIVASKTMPVLGYELQIVSDEAQAGNGDSQLMFKLTHSG
ncbi:unnamed protein product [Allacma fusca]|uniref:PH domain-containing protein n=1 Tax=Allacma fusca TaxID=39272 RepID=A0A8J2JGD1_9HEXA|nr:unnamed protein product [Allacma fusca]